MLELTSVKELRGTVVLPPDPDLLPLIATTALVSGCPVVVETVEQTPYVAELTGHFASHMDVSHEETRLSFTPRGDRAVPLDLPLERLYCGEFMLLALLGAGYRVALSDATDERIAEWKELTDAARGQLSIERDDSRVVAALTLQPDTSLPRNIVPQEQLEPMLGLALGMGATASITVDYQVSTPLRHLLPLFGYDIDVRGQERGDNAIARRIYRMARKNRQASPTMLTVAVDFSVRPHDTVQIELPGDITLGAVYLAAKALVQRGSLVMDNVCLENWATPMLQLLRRMGCSAGVQPSRQTSFGQAGMIQLQRFERVGRKVECIPLSQYRGQLPAMITLALFSQGESVFRNLARLRHDTPNGIEMLSSFLELLGAHAGDMPDGIVLRGASQYDGFDVAEPMPAHVAAAWSVVALRCMGNSSIEDTALVRRWPRFGTTLKELCEGRT